MLSIDNEIIRIGVEKWICFDQWLMRVILGKLEVVSLNPNYLGAMSIIRVSK